eukprot:5628588-Amphidinium_carterae.1
MKFCQRGAWTLDAEAFPDFCCRCARHSVLALNGRPRNSHDMDKLESRACQTRWIYDSLAD